MMMMMIISMIIVLGTSPSNAAAGLQYMSLWDYDPQQTASWVSLRSAQYFARTHVKSD